MNSSKLLWASPSEYLQWTDLPKKGAHMPTMTMENASQAKKQRDVLRNRFRTDISKYCAKFGVTQFEAAHAIMDTVLKGMDENAESMGNVGMPNGLAQTLLTYTEGMIEKHSGSAPTSYVNYDDPAPAKVSALLGGVAPAT